MASSRYVNTEFWKDNYVANLDPSEKLLFLYLLTNPRTNILGVYEVRLQEVAFDTGFDVEMVKKVIERLSNDQKLYYELGWVVIKNWTKHQTTKSPKVVEGMVRVFNNLPEWLRRDLACLPKDGDSKVCKPFSLDTVTATFIDAGYTMDTLYIRYDNYNLTKLNLTKTKPQNEHRSYTQNGDNLDAQKRRLARGKTF